MDIQDDFPPVFECNPDESAGMADEWEVVDVADVAIVELEQDYEEHEENLQYSTDEVDNGTSV
jgi:hypothetical protein